MRTQLTEKEITIIKRFEETFNIRKQIVVDELVRQNGNKKLYLETLEKEDNEYFEEILCDCSERFANLLEIKDALSIAFLPASGVTVEDIIISQANKLHKKWNELDEQSLAFASQTAKNWEERNYDSYEEYFDELYFSGYGNDFRYEQRQVELMLSDLFDKVLNTGWDLPCYVDRY